LFGQRSPTTEQSMQAVKMSHVSHLDIRPE
jgi:hypothetical protein